MFKVKRNLKLKTLFIKLHPETDIHHFLQNLNFLCAVSQVFMLSMSWESSI